MAKIAFIGLGRMGLPMALNVMQGEHDVIGYTKTEKSREYARSKGLKVVDSLSDACDGAELVITMLPDSPDVTEVILGDLGVINGLGGPASIIDMSTISPSVTRSIANAVVSRGHSFLDAPVSGGDVGAAEGELSIMVGGDRDVFKQWKPVLKLMGTTIAYLGENGAGQVTKAANQLMVAGHIQMFAEAFAFLNAQGVDPLEGFKVIAGGLAGSRIIDRKIATVAEGNFEPGFRAELHLKDLKIVASEADDIGVSLPATALVKSFFQAMVNQNLGSLDHSALVRFVGDYINKRDV